MSFLLNHAHSPLIDTLIDFRGSVKGREKRHLLLRERYQSKTDRKHLVQLDRSYFQAS